MYIQVRLMYCAGTRWVSTAWTRWSATAAAKTRPPPHAHTRMAGPGTLSPAFHAQPVVEANFFFVDNLLILALALR